MYQPYDPFAYQSYNDPKPDHYASAKPSGMPQPSRPPAFQEQPPPPKQEKQKKEERHAHQSVPKKDSGSNEEAKMIKQLKETNANLKMQLTSSKEQTDKIVHEKEAMIQMLQREIDASRSQAAAGQKEASAAAQRLSSKEQAHQQLLASVRREAEANAQRLSTKEQESQHQLAQARRDSEVSAQRFSTKEKEYQQLLAQARREAESSAQKVSLKEQEAQQLLAQARGDADTSAQKWALKEQEIQQLLAQARRDAEASAQRLAFKEQEGQQLLAQVRRDAEASAKRLALKEQVNRDLLDQIEQNDEAIAQLKREWAARLSKAEEENSLLLVRFTKLQSDTETGRACLLETNAAQEVRIMKLRDEAKQREEELMKLKDETTNHEAELMKLRDETSKLLDEKTNAHQSLKQIEVENRELEEQVRQLKGDSAELTADINAINLEKKKLSRNIAALQKELDESRNLCEKRRVRIEELDNEQLPTLNSQIELMSRLDERAKGKVVELEDRVAKLANMLEDSRRARDSLEHQLDEAEKREMESNRKMAGENRLAAEDLDRLRLNLERHQRDHAKYFATVEAEKTGLQQQVDKLDGAKKEALDRISALEKSLEDFTEMRDTLQEELGIVQDAFGREVQEGDDARAEYKLSMEKLEEQILTLTSAKTTLEAQVAAFEAKQIETKAVIKALKEDVENHKTERSNLEEQLSTLTPHVAESEAKKVETEGILKALNEEIKKHKTETETLRSTIHSSTLQSSALNKEIESYKTEIQTLRLKIEVQVAETEAKKTEMELMVQAMVKASNEEMEDHKTDTDTLRSNIEKLQADISSLSSAKRALEAQVAESEFKRTEAEQMLHATEEMLKAVEEDVKKHKMDTETAARGFEENSLLEGKMVDLEKRNAELSGQIMQFEKQVSSLEEEKVELFLKLDSVENIVVQHEETLARNEVELLNKKRIEREVKMVRLELSKYEEDFKALEAEIGRLTNQVQDGNERVKELEAERTKLEARNVAYLEDKKAAAVKASALDLELREKETGYKELNNRFVEINGVAQDANERVKELEAERTELAARNVAYLEDKKAAAVKASALDLELREKEKDFKELNDRFVEINGKYMDIVAEREELTQTIRNLRK